PRPLAYHFSIDPRIGQFGVNRGDRIARNAATPRAADFHDTAMFVHGRGIAVAKECTRGAVALLLPNDGLLTMFVYFAFQHLLKRLAADITQTPARLIGERPREHIAIH